jgi:predicted phosphoribosyltransferase
MDVFVVRKLGLPGHPELAMGAIASGGVRAMNEDVIMLYRPSAAGIEAVTRAELTELNRLEQAYRDGWQPLPVEGRTVVLVDVFWDGQTRLLFDEGGLGLIMLVGAIAFPSMFGGCPSGC